MNDQPARVSAAAPAPPVEVGSPDGPPPVPVSAGERSETLDVVRGFALLGILSMNIISIGLPGIARLNPTVGGGFEGANFAAWVVCYLLFDEKMLTIFSMLFGAGLVLLAQRHEGRGSAGLFYRRAGWLLVIGLLHGYLLWSGDILYTYALTGMVAYLFRKKSPPTLLVLGFASLGVAAGLSQVVSAVLASARGDGADPFVPSPEKSAEDVEAVRNGSYLDLLVRRAPETFEFQTVIFLAGLFPITLGRMLIGLALMKLGVFTGERPPRFYWKLLAVGYGVGLPLAAVGALLQVRHGFDFVFLFGGGREPNNFGSVFVALGHVAALVLVCKAGVAARLTARLAAVGRMALTNYLMQTVICTTLFWGYGLGLYARFDRVQLLGIMVAIWVAQLAYSSLWLARYRFGPAEWVWRSLTYRRFQPMRVPTPAGAQAARAAEPSLREAP